ncbi:MAG TPA: ABC transporter permease [Gemmatimonadaceae bacterium]|nr:ABC transporter permease [Gemmatimonadaceae bacterium]
MTGLRTSDVPGDELAPSSESRGAVPFIIPVGRFISRGQLALSAVYWLAWLTVSRRPAMSTGIQREFEGLALGALKLVAASSVLVGLITIFQVAYQLAEYSAEMMSVRAIGWFAARELGPVAVALLVVARNAAGIAGELASMRANGEIDALRAMGLDPVKYLVAPKLAALLVAVPALTIIADGLITFGGWLGGTLFLKYSTSYFFDQYRLAFDIRDLFVGLAKSVVFAFIIVMVAADEGLNVEGRVTAIGVAATRAVVYAVILVLAADTLVNAVFYFIPVLV